MNKYKVVLLVGGAVAVAGYVFRKPLRERTNQLAGHLIEVLEEMEQKRYHQLVDKYAEPTRSGAE